MAKNKLDKYQRVQHLPNVTFSRLGDLKPPHTYPWYAERYTGTEKVLELGCGKGEHSLAFAADDPRRVYVGVDRKSYRLCVGAERALAERLENVHFLRAPIERIREFFIDGSIKAIWLTFPDPHPKTRAAKLRLSAPFFLDRYVQLLEPKGMVHLKTDSDMLYEYTGEAVERWGGEVVTAVRNIHIKEMNPPGVRGIVSAFEQSACSKGRTIKYMAFKLR